MAIHQTKVSIFLPLEPELLQAAWSVWYLSPRTVFGACGQCGIPKAANDS
jgi:hypothetical protein